MKKLLLSIIGLTMSFFLDAQTVYQNYLDGAIWVKLNNKFVKNATIDFETGHVTKTITSKDLPFSKELERYGVTSTTMPFEVANDSKLKNIVRIEFENSSEVDQLLRDLSKNEMVEYAEKVPFLKSTVTPNDPNYNTSTQWNLFQVNASDAWNISTGNAAVTVAIVDDAVEITHPDLAPAIWTNPNEIPNNGIDDDGNGYVDDVNGWDAADQNNDPNPPNGNYDHGTHVAGISGAATDNGLGVASIGHNLTLIPVKATNSVGAVTHGYEGIIYAVAAGADVINMSWGGSGSSQTAQNIITYASNQGIVLVAAAGNDNVSSIFYPAGYTEVIAVASTTFGDNKSNFSNYGAWIDISAPGSAIYSTVPGGGYQTKQGTSMASPMVAGLAGLMLSHNQSLSPSDIKNCLYTTAENIDAANPSYVGELGAGRIDALAAMNCIDQTLTWAPQAEFSANNITILEGQAVNFTDQSIYNPTTWNWTFTGGNPASFNGQNPPQIEYNVAGTYEVSLEVSNANGTDTEVKSAYITVNALTGCDTVSNTLTTDQIFTYSYTNSSGYLAGHNDLDIDQWAEKFTNLGPTNIMGAEFYFTRGETNDPNSFITLSVWEANGTGNPGNLVYTEDVPISVIEDNVNGPGVAGQFYITNIAFDQPVSVTTNDFFVGYTLTNGVAGDTVACGLVEDFQGNAARPNTLWANLSGTWNSYEVLTGGVGTGSKFSAHIYPRITPDPPQAIILPDESTVCVGDFITFDGSTSPNTVNWQWAINGTSTPYPTDLSPNVIMNSAGDHWAYMLAENHCGFFHIDSVEVTVNALPTLNVTASSDTICIGNTADLEVTGATTYAWSPAGSLSCGTCANPVAEPTSTTTYSVVGSQGGCETEGLYTIVVDDLQPEADFLISNDTICEGDQLSINGGVTEGASQFAWTLNGANPASAVGSVVSVLYNTAGTFTIDLTASNSCGLTDDASKTVVVLSEADCPTSSLLSQSLNEALIFFNGTDNLLYVDLSQLSGDGDLYITSVTGQVIHESTAKFGVTEFYELSHLSPGMYMVVVTSGSERIMKKFVK